MSPPQGLVALQARLTHDLACLQWPAARWTPLWRYQGQPVVDVVIVGAGMAGLALAAALLLRGLQVSVFDEAEAGWEGPWATTARMETLRSPKQLPGPALGLASLTFRAWFEAQFDDATWQALDKIPRLQWMDYLRWYRQVLGQVLGLVVHNGHCVTDVLPQGPISLEGDGPGTEIGLVELRLLARGQPQTVWARHVVLATGRAGLGGPALPPYARQLPSTRWAHSADPFDAQALRGQRVGVVGAGASAMDSAATALEAGAARVHLLVRRHDLPRINKGKGASHPGFVQGYAGLADAWKWRIRHYIHVQQVPPPQNSTLRVSKHANAFFHLGCAIQSVAEHPGGLLLQTTLGPIELDCLIFSTGFKVDWAQRPMLRHIAPQVRLWKHRFCPPPGEEDEELNDSPDLGENFEFQLRPGGHCPGLERVHCFSYPAALSRGVITGDIPAISDGAQQLANALAGLLYGEDIEHHYQRMLSFAEPELMGDEWVATPLPPMGR